MTPPLDINPGASSPDIRCAIALGSNVGDRRHNLLKALRAIRELTVDGRLDASSFFETPPWGVANQELFLNAACVGVFREDPSKLLLKLLEIERRLGRPSRHPHWGPRVIDLDLIHAEGVRRRTPELTLPHPRAAERAFVLAPLREIAPNIAQDLAPPSNEEKTFPLAMKREDVERELFQSSPLDTNPLRRR